MRATGRAVWGAIFVTLVASSASSVRADDNVLSDREADEGFVRLFNGEDLAGWTVRHGEGSTWGVKGGAMTDSGRPNGFICTDADYEDYVLRLQVRHLAKTNSGVLLRATDLDRPWPRSIEAQCKSGSMGDIYNFGKFP